MLERVHPTVCGTVAAATWKVLGGGVMVLVLPGCLINTDLYERRKAELTDGDGDGYAMEDECDDDDAGVYPGAAELCDGLDQDCDGEVDEEATDMHAWFEDADGDSHGDATAETLACDAPPGFVSTDDDCDDADATAFPEAADEWYDGIDSNCDGADDYDADGDGDRWDEAGGTDCDDQDVAVAGTKEEGWSDAGVDNNSDGSIEDQVLAEVGDLGERVDGSGADSSFGATVVALPAGWAHLEAVLLVAAPGSSSGDVYGWRATELSGSPSTEGASWHLSGSNDADYYGFGMGWAGESERPLVIVGAEGALETRGQVDVWAGDDLAGAATFAIAGESTGAFLGAQVVSGHDHDGDGVADVLVTAQLDSRIATNAGAAFIFLDTDGLAGSVPVSLADIEFTTTYAGALLSVTSVGDIDDDGLADLGFTQDIPYPTGPGGLLVTAARSNGSYDVEGTSSAQLSGGPFTFGRAWDPDGDGSMALLAASGGIHSFALPLVGVVTPWDDAEQTLGFEDSDHTTRWIRTDTDAYAGHGAFVTSSANYEGSRGMVGVLRPYWSEGQTIDEAPFLALGDAAGDLAGWGLDLLDWDGDGVSDLAVGVPGADTAGVGSGSLYLIPGPR